MALKRLDFLDLRTAASAPDDLAPDLTFKELVEAHEMVLPHKQLGPRLRKWVDAFGELNAWELTSAQLTKASNEMIRLGYAGGSVNRDLGAIGQLFAWAIKRRRIAPIGFISPTRGVPRHPEAIRRVYVTDEEMSKLRLLARTAFKDKRFTLYVWMLADSGARKGEILPRKWSELDIEGRKLVLETSKNNAPRTLWFGQETMDLARKLKPKVDGLLFPGRYDTTVPMSYRKKWAQLTEMAGLPNLHCHDLRHIVAASLLGSGVSIAVTAAVLGHKSHIMTSSRYGHLSQELVGSVMADRFSATTTAPRS